VKSEVPNRFGLQISNYLRSEIWNLNFAILTIYNLKFYSLGSRHEAISAATPALFTSSALFA
jgi:hypothetical protein